MLPRVPPKVHSVCTGFRAYHLQEVYLETAILTRARFLVSVMVRSTLRAQYFFIYRLPDFGIFL